jgi:hypothetical protein
MDGLGTAGLVCTLAPDCPRAEYPATSRPHFLGTLGCAEFGDSWPNSPIQSIARLRVAGGGADGDAPDHQAAALGFPPVSLNHPGVVPHDEI